MSLAPYGAAIAVAFHVLIELALIVRVLLRPHRQPAARIVQVSSALAFVPLVVAPLYSATKAAVHAFTVALREQLKGGPVQVIELMPPAVKTELHRGQTREQIRQMSLEDFTVQAMRGLDAGRDEIAVGLARVARLGSRLAPRMLLKMVNKPR